VQEERLTTATFAHETTTKVYGTIKVNPDDPYSDVAKKIFHDEVNDFNYCEGYMYYALYDIDGNGTEEFIQGLGGGERKLINAVYAIQNGIALRQEEYWYPDVERALSALLFKNGTIRDINETDGELSFTYFRFENGALKRQTTLIDDYGEYYRFNLTIDKTRITKKEFNRLRKKYEGDGQVVELDWKPLAEYGR